jgi:hypothetical protein
MLLWCVPRIGGMVVCTIKSGGIIGRWRKKYTLSFTDVLLFAYCVWNSPKRMMSSPRTYSELQVRSLDGWHAAISWRCYGAFCEESWPWTCAWTVTSRVAGIYSICRIYEQWIRKGTMRTSENWKGIKEKKVTYRAVNSKIEPDESGAQHFYGWTNNRDRPAALCPLLKRWN